MDGDMSVVGCRHWDRNLARNVGEHRALDTICDSNSAALRKLETLYLGGNTISYTRLPIQVAGIGPPSLPVSHGSYQIHVSVNDVAEDNLGGWYRQPKLGIPPRDESVLPPRWQRTLNISGEFITVLIPDSIEDIHL